MLTTTKLDRRRRRPSARCLRIVSIGVLLGALLGGEAEGQTVHRGTDVGSLQPWRGYFSPQGVDHVDTKTGNLVLTSADLVLPGNHVHNLVSRRTYNNDTVQPPASYGVTGWRWSVGLDGLVMRVLEKSWPTNTPISTLEQEINNTPIFVMGDGSLKRTRYFYQYVASTGTAGQNAQGSVLRLRASRSWHHTTCAARALVSATWRVANSSRSSFSWGMSPSRRRSGTWGASRAPMRRE